MIDDTMKALQSDKLVSRSGSIINQKRLLNKGYIITGNAM